MRGREWSSARISPLLPAVPAAGISLAPRPAVEPATRRQSLREQLGRAREALDRGEPDEALAAVDRALQIDPDYLAAQALREHILRQPVLAVVPALDAAAGERSGTRSSTAARAFTSGVQRLEARTRARRIEKRAAAARAALASGRIGLARAAVDEIAGIDRQHPEHSLLLAELDAAARVRRRPRFGLAIAAVAVCGASILVVRYADRPRLSAPPASMQPSAPAVDVTDTAVPSTAAAISAVPDAEPVVDAHDTSPSPPPIATVPASASTATPTLPVSTSGRSLSSPLSVTLGANRPDMPAPVGAAPASVDRRDPASQIGPIEPPDPAQLPGALTLAGAIAPPPGTSAMRDEDLVLRTLGQYRRAYDTLDARAAQAVWPAVDSAALQRAFDGLVSQRLTFQSCQLQVTGAMASAACRGTARYTPRVGGREARDEPRNWRFTLRRTASDEWRIESASVAR